MKKKNEKRKWEMGNLRHELRSNDKKWKIKNWKLLTILCVTSILFVVHGAFAEDETAQPVSAETIPITIRIETPSSTIMAEQRVQVPSGCTVTDIAGTQHDIVGYKAVCALQALSEQQILTYTVLNYSFGLFLDSINNFATAPDWSQSWVLWNNNTLAQVGVADLDLLINDSLLLTYGGPFPVAPLTVTATPDTVTASSTVHLFAEYFLDNGQRERYHGPIAYQINTTTFNSESGILDWEPTAPGTYSIMASAATSTRSLPVIVTVEAPEITTPTDDTTPPPADTTPPDNSPPNNPGDCSSCTRNQLNVPLAIDFLQSAQNSDGSIGSSPFYSDWTAIAFGAYEGDNTESKGNLGDYLLSDPSPGTLATDFERRAMALMALGINPYDGAATDYIASIAGFFSTSTGQIGDPALVNDDIFALFPLIKAGYQSIDQIIASTTEFIIGYQSADGSWGSVDLTAAAIQALQLVPTIPGANNAVGNAKNYLRGAQHDDGGFGYGAASNADSTAWAMQAISALGEQESNWVKNGKTSGDFLFSQQQTDGGLRPASDTPDNRIWTTAYAIPGGLGKSWSAIMAAFTRPAISNQPPQDNNVPDNSGPVSVNNSGGRSFGGGSATAETITATTTVISATTTTLAAAIDQNIPTESMLFAARAFAEAIPLPEPIQAIAGIKITLEETQTNMVLIDDTPSSTASPDTVEPVATDSVNTADEQLTAPPTASPVSAPRFWSATAVFRLALILTATIGVYLAWRLWQKFV